MHVSAEDIADTAFGFEIDEDCNNLNTDDHLSSIVQQINLSDPVYTFRICKRKIDIKGNYEYCGNTTVTANLMKNRSENNSCIDEQLGEPNVVLWHPSKVCLGWSTSYPRGAGMVNVGNTCYLNSSLQALFHIPAMANWLLDEIQSHIKICENNSSCIGFCSICAMMRTIHISLSNSSNTMKPSLIHNRLKSIGKTFQYGRQEDAHEFIKLLLDHMQRSYILSCRVGKLDHRSRETTPLNQIFGGYLRQQVICPLCHYVSTTFSHFQDIVLDITSVASVQAALRNYFQKETLDSENAYKCENCHKRVPATKQHLIESMPNVLLLQLKRFSLTGNKVNKNITIQEEINLSHYLSHRSTQTNKEHKYKLVSMVNHHGSSQHSGHYTAVARTSNGCMYVFDDNNVRYIPMESALCQNPYVLFYELVKESKACKMEELDVLSKNVFINNKINRKSLDKNDAGSSHISDRKEEAVAIEPSSPHDPITLNRNKISFHIKNESLTSTALSSEDINYLKSNNNVKTWDGRPSSTFQSSKSNYSKKRSADDAYNEEYDVGKQSKKKRKFDEIRRQNNPFQSYQKMMQNDGEHRSNNYYNNYKHHKHQKRNFHHNKNHDGYGRNYHRNSYKSKHWHQRNRYRGGSNCYSHYNRS